MLQVKTTHQLGDLENVLLRAAQSHGAAVLTCANLGQMMREHGVSAPRDAVILAICAPELYARLLEADVRFSAFLPCRIAGYQEGGKVTLETVSPREFCRILNRPDLEHLAVPLENVLREILRDASENAMAAAQSAPSPARCSGLGATEEQMSVRGSLPQRIDKKGSKIEDLAGTGEHDSQGG